VSAPRHPDHDEIVASAQSLMDVLELGEVKAVADRQMDAMGAALDILGEVAMLRAEDAPNDFAHGLVVGQQNLARRLLKVIKREMQG
jgi:hypothetical protein